MTARCVFLSSNKFLYSTLVFLPHLKGYYFLLTFKNRILNFDGLRMSDQPPVKKAKEESTLDADLIAAARSNDFEKVSKLLEDGADAAFQEEESGTSVLMAAAENKNIKMIKLLLENGAPWNALDRKHECAGDYAVKTGDQVRKIGL